MSNVILFGPLRFAVALTGTLALEWGGHLSAFLDTFALNSRSEVQGLSRPCGRESLFFACAKKSNQKKAHPVLAPGALRATGAQGRQKFL
ncbi:hypothetical protein [Xanthomonas sp. LMC-A-07]|uniref:hypothetical protein n=1 Tax=Xanthomonas sp. LMC-A-07 TaxID=3040329 RepID=UPI002556EB32|nr:hypothetical protein [Xanthomonas sp. LMC-A-07]MEB2232144.1 hypothetical protein [Xanthomonas campestris pv. campestris]